MFIKTKLDNLLNRTEAELQVLIAEAAQKKDYALAAEMAGLARMLEEQWPRVGTTTSAP